MKVLWKGPLAFRRGDLVTIGNSGMEYRITRIQKDVSRPHAPATLTLEVPDARPLPLFKEVEQTVCRFAGPLVDVMATAR